jgi:hypothetical protein
MFVGNLLFICFIDSYLGTVAVSIPIAFAFYLSVNSFLRCTDTKIHIFISCKQLTKLEIAAVRDR